MIELLLQAERLLSVGLLDKAEQLYRQVANADPKNSIAVVGLARVTLDRGDDEGALELARRAVAIDPENAAAQRLVARLEEVLEYRQSAESLLFDRTEAVSALQAEVAAEVAAEVGAMPGGDEPVETSGAAAAPEPDGADETAEASGTAEANVPAGAEPSDGQAGPTEDPAPAEPTPAAAADPSGDGEIAVEPVEAPPTPAPPTRTEPTPAAPAGPPATPLGAGPVDPPWADVKVPDPEPTPPPAVEPQVPYIPPSTSAPGGSDGATAQTGILGYLERLFRRR